MATETSHYGFSLREDSDIFNPLSTNKNFEQIDTLLYAASEGGIPVVTPVVSGNTMNFSDFTLAGNSTVKFTLSAAQQVNKVVYSGGTINVIGLDGEAATVSGGTFLGYVDGPNFQVIVWPDNVDAKTFDGKQSSYYATASDLATTNANVATAQNTAEAAGTVANQALEAAQSAGGASLLWTNPAPTASMPAGNSFTVSGLSTCKIAYVIYNANTYRNYYRTDVILPQGPDYQQIGGPSIWYKSGVGETAAAYRTFKISGDTLTTDTATGGAGTAEGGNYCVPYQVWGIK